MGIGGLELVIILFFAFLLFGAKRLPSIARSLGRSIYEFKREINSTVREVKKDIKNRE